MAGFKRINRVLLGGVACMALASCDGSDSVASPGAGSVTIITPPAPTPTPSPTPTATPTPTAGPAPSCPAGTTDVGVVANTYRSCRLPVLITTNLSLPRVQGVAYELNGRVDVGVDTGGAGNVGTAASLTIAPGSVVYANTAGSDNDFLVVNRGSRLVADGTEQAPIVFTALQNLTGTVTEESQGLWGGIIMAGRAPISNCNATGVTGGSVGCENVVEGTTTALYGGATPTDNSGVVRYVQIRYSGTVISPNNELQGLTLAGTGSGTVIDRVQVHNSSDDGIEIFGGRTNLRYLAITGADDDGFDTDVGWQGFAQFVIAIQRPASNTNESHATEIDSNNSEDFLPRQRYNLANFTYVQSATGSFVAAIRLRGGADARFVNGLVEGPAACLNIIAGATSATDKSTIRPANTTIDDLGPPVFNSVLFSCATPYQETTVNSITVTNAEQQAIFTSTPSTNNNENAGDIVTNGFRPTGAATTATAFNAATLNPTGSPFFVTTNFVGAVSPTAGDPNATWFERWTCNSNRANFGATSATCTAAPTT